MSKRRRLDQALVDLGLAASQGKAQALILAGQVRVDGQVARKASDLVPGDAEVRVDPGPPYVSRGGQKLAGALDAFPQVDPAGVVALDAGASTGGFTDCLLQRGADKVYAVDVGYGQLDWRLRNDARVVVMERTNIRHLDALPEGVDLVTADLSFIGLTKVLPALMRSLRAGGDMLLLVKPQFELDRSQVGRGGVVREDALRHAAVDKVSAAAVGLGLLEAGRCDSSLPGPKGNREIVLWLTWPA